MRLRVYFENLQDKEVIRYSLKMLVRRAIEATLAYENMSDDCEVSVTFCDNEKIRQMNNRFRGIDRETDVLSFPLFDYEGEADEPENVREDDPETNVENVASEVAVAEGAEGAIEFANVEKAWVYTVDGKFVKFVNNNPVAVEAEPGVYLVKMQLGNVIRNAKVLVK